MKIKLPKFVYLVQASTTWNSLIDCVVQIERASENGIRNIPVETVQRYFITARLGNDLFQVHGMTAEVRILKRNYFISNYDII